MEASLDIVKREEILQSVHEGDNVDVKYEDESSPAVILKMNGEISEWVNAYFMFSWLNY